MAVNTDLKAFGRWLAHHRRNKGFTQAQAAKRARISRVRWSQIERGVGQPRKATVRRIVKTVDGRVGHAFMLLNYPAKEVETAYMIDRVEKQRLAKAIRDFKDILFNARETEAGFTLINIYRVFRDWKPSRDVDSALNSSEYREALEKALELNPLHQWFLACEIIISLWRTRGIPCFPEVPEFEEFNRRQSKVLKIIANTMKELRITASLRDRTRLDEYRRELLRQKASKD